MWRLRYIHERERGRLVQLVMALRQSRNNEHASQVWSPAVNNDG